MSTNAALRAFVIAGGAASVVACGWSDRHLRVYDHALRLTVKAPEELQSGRQVEFSLELTNTSTHVVEACFGPSRQVSLKYVGGGRTRFIEVNHPGCVKQFRLEPASELAWEETLEIPAAPVGRGTVEVSVEIVDPTQCGMFGCPHTMRSASKPVMIR